MPAQADQPVLILTGPPGAGKTTVARLLAERAPRAVHLESDHFFRFIASGYVEPWLPASREQNAVVMRIVAGAASAYATAGYFTIVDGIVLPRYFFDPLRDALRQAGQRVAYAVLRAPLEICAARAAARTSQPPAEREVVETLWRELADLGPLERHAVDVEAEPPAEVAELMAARLDDGSLRA